jgi:hypothetical protein
MDQLKNDIKKGQSLGIHERDSCVHRQAWGCQERDPQLAHGMKAFIDRRYPKAKL